MNVVYLCRSNIAVDSCYPGLRQHVASLGGRAQIVAPGAAMCGHPIDVLVLLYYPYGRREGEWFKNVIYTRTAPHWLLIDATSVTC